jgi:hypothetical protein
MWPSELSHVVETEGDRKARDLTELPLADLTEAFATGAKKVCAFQRCDAPSLLTVRR